MIATLLLAAGASRRMRGGDKLLEEIDGEPLLRLMARRCLAARLGPVLVPLPALDHPRAAVLQGLDARPLAVPEAAEGMGASIRTAVAALDMPLRGVLILPADMPEITTEDLQSLASAFQGTPLPILRGASGETPGHPVLFPAALMPELEKLNGDRGASPVIAAHKDLLRLVPLPGAHATTDLDAPEAWSEWRRSRGR
ncbi:CTP:molybdopterin cytidylyltransferase MocA [Pseudooceanicola antarcticus]|uniref:CTP:molybdopterin cytidylyltransferase MocA n=1 Tax=Pseudooceanicola antarcticus TaxID=1247613 RepID=A0A285IZH6_9RHOB|nr:nucleotidyltransferase family protein [Pseudooceanicola antarcticus]PJE25649.1 nucleotidyltransferase family protein [Pseudooceanicola antarcticus]SNY53382.1 CTP:molybdopterin cytidylyltransferase MocA [Pseudooceanicola antarcticus]